MHDEEIKYLLDIVDGIQYHKNRFKVMIGEDRYLLGFSPSLDSVNNPLCRLMQYKTLYDTLVDLDYKIKISFRKAIEHAYSDKLNESFSLFQENTKEEINTYYFIENALFRTSSLWDLLAQLYRLYYNIEIDVTEVHYKKIFNPKLKFCDSFKEQATEINSYLNQDDDIECQDKWKGNHRYANDCRNKMIHRNSPNVASMSDYDVNFKKHPSYMLKRIIEDYDMTSIYIDKILNEIEKEIMESVSDASFE